MRELRRLAKSRVLPVTVPHPRVQVRVAAANVSQIAFEVLDVDCVEADDGRVQAHICLSHVFAVVVWT
jgi:hypothetical protein